MKIQFALAWAVAVSSAAPLVAQSIKGVATSPAGTTAVEFVESLSGGGVPANAAPGDRPQATEPGKNPEQDAKQKAEARKQQRLQKIAQLQFDRRPSAILKKWTDLVRKDAETQPADDKPVEARRPDDPVEALKPLDARQQAELDEAAADKEFDKKLADLQRDVTLGRWADVKAFLKQLPEEEAKPAYDRLLDALRSGPMGGMQGVDPNMLSRMVLDGADAVKMQSMLGSLGQGPGAQFAEKNVFTVPDVVGLIEAAPHALKDESFTKLGTIVRHMLAAGNDLEDLIGKLDPDKSTAEKKTLDRRQLAKLLFATGQDVRGGDFLPPLEEAQTKKDAEALNLLARHFLALHAKEKKDEILTNAWTATQAVLEAEKITREQEEEALKRAVEIAPRIPEEHGKKWLDESFTTRIDRGRDILATIGSLVATSLQTRPQDPDFRLRTLKLQRTAVEALIAASPATAAEWDDVLTVLAGKWLDEAGVSQQFDQSMQYNDWRFDRYGNPYFMGEEGMGMYPMQYMQNQIRPVATADLLETQPNGEWLKLVDSGLKPKFATTFAGLYLKADEEEQAFPFIEQLAQTDAEKGRELAHEFLRVWTKNHNPNESRDRYRPYFYYYGYEQRAERIPLTRSKQERNLKELAVWIKRLKALPVGELDEKLLAGAFTTSHSNAEVYRLDALENVFGSLDALQPRTLAELIQQMRGNLAGVWRQPDVQKQNSTNRKQKDIEAEVQRGYALADSVVDRALEKHPDHWSLLLAKAALIYDQNDYRQELEKTSEYSEKRTEALALFARAAEQYRLAVPELAESDETTLVYDQWFYAGLGSVDIARITAEKVPDLKQPALVRAAMLALPPEAAERHMDRFATNLFSRLSSAKPELKFRYLRTGFEIVGDHKLARQARKVLDYYNDLVTEIKLVARVDGSDSVGHGQPFGVFVDIQHTKEIERESGGFNRYLQNQNNNQYYYYNFGRPLENYRDKFSDMADQALQEHFEVVSITFQDPKVNSKALPEYGWRATPYAYLLLKAKGPEVDKLPPMRLDLDFLDTSGYAIIPVESPALPLDAKPPSPPSRPAENIKITQTLDERQADEGKLILEIKATARGIVPKLDELLDLKPADFEVVETNDEGASIVEFDKESSETAVTSERIWMITLNAKPGLAERPKSFQFASAKVPTQELLYQRYADADLFPAEALISLEERYASPRRLPWWLWVGLATLAAAAVSFVVYQRSRTAAPVVASRFQMPTTVTPFTVLGLLRDIQHNNGIGETGQRELSESIAQLERRYFEESESPETDLRDLASRWLSRARA